MTAIEKLSVKSWAGWGLIATSIVLICAPVPAPLKPVVPLLTAIGLALVLHAHAVRRGGWDRVSAFAALGAIALVLLVLGLAAFWSIYFATDGFAD